MFVDDDKDDLEFYGEILQETISNLVIYQARSGSEAIRLLNAAELPDSLPRLIIIDMNMPVMDGMETILQIKKEKRFSPIPIVVLSTARVLRESGQLQMLGISHFTKPSSYAEMKKIAQLLLRFFNDENNPPR